MHEEKRITEHHRCVVLAQNSGTLVKVKVLEGPLKDEAHWFLTRSKFLFGEQAIIKWGAVEKLEGTEPNPIVPFKAEADHKVCEEVAKSVIELALKNLEDLE